MSNYISSFKNRTSSKAKKNKFDLSCNVVTTQDFFVNKPVYVKELIPHEKISIDVDYFSRLSPIVEPFLGRARNVMRAFFVPSRTIMCNWNEFITQTSYLGQVPSAVPFCSLKVFHDLFIPLESNDPYKLVRPADSRPSNYQTPDFYSYYNPPVSGDPRVGFCFTSKGRIFYDILVNLGYRIDFDVTPDQYNNNTFWTDVSLMPLFAFCKLHKDWFSNSAYDTETDIDDLIKTPFNPNDFTTGILWNLLDNVYRVMYKSDYFTSAWDNPVSPNDTNIDGSIFIDDNTVKSSGSNNVRSLVRNNSVSSTNGSSNGTPVVNGASGSTLSYSSSPLNLSQYILDSLKRVTDYIKRHQLAGSRVLDRYKAQFGIDLAPAKMDRSIYLGKHMSDMLISDVMQTTPDTEDGSSSAYGVGNYAGRGMILNNKNGHFEFETEEFGYLIITSCVIPRIIYGDGQSKTVSRISAFDFYTGDFDNVGVQPIAVEELSAGYTTFNSLEEGIARKDIFGYTPRYSDYKTGVHQDNVSGDFILNSRKTSLEGWVLYRRYDPQFADDYSLPLVHDKEFTLGDGNLYNYVFQENTQYADHFFSLFDFHVTSYMPVKPLYELYDFDVNNGGSETIQQVNGTNVSNM